MINELRYRLKTADEYYNVDYGMHRVLILGGDQDLQQRVDKLLVEVGNVSAVSSLKHIPGEIELSRVLQTYQPDIVLVVVNSMMAVVDLMHRMEMQAPDTCVIALSQFTDQRTVRELMLAGVKGLIPMPLAKGPFVETFGRAVAELRHIKQAEPLPNLYSFLPGKGGCGTSRLACHFGISLAAEALRTRTGRVLLLDLDISSGLSRYLFERSTSHSLIEMIEAGVQLDATYWNQFVARHGNLDVICGGRANPRHPLSPSKVKQVIDTAAEQYRAICVDLTGNAETFSLDILRRSAHIFIVTSTDPGALHLTKERMNFLQSLGLSKRVSVLLNRFTRHTSTQPSRVAAEIGAPVVAEFDFDDRGVHKSITDGKTFQADTAISGHIQQMARKLIWEPSHAALMTARTA